MPVGRTLKLVPKKSCPAGGIYNFRCFLFSGSIMMEIDFNDIVYVGFNSRIAAMDTNSGDLLRQWRAPKPSSGGYVTLLILDENRLSIHCIIPPYIQDGLSFELFSQKTKKCALDRSYEDPTDRLLFVQARRAEI
jgi:hypothetical protein